MPLVAKRPGHTVTTYRLAKPDLRISFGHCCCYCRIHEGQYGGQRNFHVDHFKPKSKFPLLATVYDNLVYSCGACNCFKGRDWHDGDPRVQPRGYYDPREHDYAAVLPVGPTGKLEPTGGAGKYLIERLHLNAPHLVRARALIRWLAEVPATCAGALQLLGTFVPQTAKEAELVDLLRKAIGLNQKMAQTVLAVLTTPV